MSSLISVILIERFWTLGCVHRLINNTDITLDVVFSRFMGFSFRITMRLHGVKRMRSLCPVIQRGLRGTPLGFCLIVIVNEKSVNLEKTTPIVLSVILINLWLSYLIFNWIKVRPHTAHNANRIEVFFIVLIKLVFAVHSSQSNGYTNSVLPTCSIHTLR